MQLRYSGIPYHGNSLDGKLTLIRESQRLPRFQDLNSFPRHTTKPHFPNSLVVRYGRRYAFQLRYCEQNCHAFSSISFALHCLSSDDYGDCRSHRVEEVSVPESPCEEADQEYFKQELKLPK